MTKNGHYNGNIAYLQGNKTIQFGAFVQGEERDTAVYQAEGESNKLY